MFRRKNTAPEIPAGQRIAQIHYETTVRDVRTFALNGTAPDPAAVQQVIESGRAAGIPSDQLARDADAMRAWAKRS